jgi:hypothetical protein
VTFRLATVRTSVRWTLPLAFGACVGWCTAVRFAWGQTAVPGGTSSTPADANASAVGSGTLSVDGDATVPVIPLLVEGCRVDEMKEVRRLLKIELEAEVIGGDAAASNDPKATGVRVKVVCREAEYRIFVIDADPERTRTRELDLSATGARARPRFVALSIVEAMTTLPKPVEPPVVQKIPAPVQAVVVPAAPVEASTPVATEVLVQALGRYFPATSRANWGLGVLLSHAIRPRLSLEIDLTGEGGRQTLDEGDLSILAASLGSGASYVHRQKDFSFRFGGGLRFGVAQITGEADDPTRTTEDAFAGPWGGPFLSAGVGALVGDSIVVRIGAEAGHALLQSTGKVRAPAEDGSLEVRDAGGVEGPWLALFASAGWLP